MDRKKFIIGIAGLALLLAALAGLTGWYANSLQVKQLESQLTELQRREKHSAVLQSVSKQMEEIAVQQNAASDRQREEAVQQTRIANEMRERSEEERRNAIVAQQQAIASERRALDAYDQAQQQRQLAEHQRIQAELSKRVADTLSYISLGRSLGSLAIGQSLTGNQEMADLLCYAAYLYTTRYGGDVYTPSVFQPLALCSQSTNQWRRHDAAIMDFAFVPGRNDQIVTVGTYGQVMLHERTANGLKTSVLFKDSKFDFRSVYINGKTGTIYAASRNGYLFIQTGKGSQTLQLNMMSHPMEVQCLQDERYLLIIGDDGLAKLDMSNNTIVGSRKLDFKVTFAHRYDYAPVLFDDRGRMHIVRDIDHFVTKKVPVIGRVTAFASSKKYNYEIYGMDNGTLFLIDGHHKIRRLTGHRSRISWIKANGPSLYTSSYDGTLNLWITSSEKIEPMTLFTTGSWIHFFNFEPTKNYLWISDQKGNLIETLVSTSMMAEMVRQKLKRNLTTEEWNYYIGRNVPYEPFLSQGRKGGGR